MCSVALISSIQARLQRYVTLPELADRHPECPYSIQKLPVIKRLRYEITNRWSHTILGHQSCTRLRTISRVEGSGKSLRNTSSISVRELLIPSFLANAALWASEYNGGSCMWSPTNRTRRADACNGQLT